MMISRPKTFNFGHDNGLGRARNELQRVQHFKYLGSSVEETEGMATEITQRVSAAWTNWKRCSGVLCDQRIPVKMNGKVYKTVVRPALFYGSETWATTRGQEARLEVNDIWTQEPSPAAASRVKRAVQRNDIRCRLFEALPQAHDKQDENILVIAEVDFHFNIETVVELAEGCTIGGIAQTEIEILSYASSL